ncbi:hypothetical protein Lgee_1882 [Legionella geestiana]|uniref:Uncharacterized protein n=1 Tax=Legionella geestiana TaxID=45065 RepID=A0A0W0TPP5_9GAMM|nr:hypothetical protein Lgee_1882 [Legionella geestiana]STX55208.1 Uncharacterised protein [Legionella geestiana]
MTVIRRIRMQLKDGIHPSEISPPYADFLLEHATELMGLRDQSGEPLISAVIPRCNTAGSVFVTDICFPSEAAYACYEEHHATVMRSRIPATYPAAASSEKSPFEYRIHTNQPDKLVDFNALLPDSETLTPITPAATTAPHAATGSFSFWGAGQRPNTECPAASSISPCASSDTDCLAWP